MVLYYFGRIVNIHYSLLPSFGGLIGVKPIEKALELGCKYIGPTCHIVDEGSYCQMWCMEDHAVAC
ncbi:formyltransferase family protein [Vibrio harveyi]|uniref:formyltransferase family protein n=1 Tax=Vibrio harveyi TaxID=669 RepID=UPI00131E4160